jgi:hypothetical protein
MFIVCPAAVYRRTGNKPHFLESPRRLLSDKKQYVEMNALDLIAAVFYSGILSLKMAF